MIQIKVKSTSKLASILKSPQKSRTYSEISATRKEFENSGEIPKTHKRGQITYTSESKVSKVTDYPSFSVVFGRTETKFRNSPSPTTKVMHIADVPKKKKVEAYPSQSYDMIKGQELLKKRYLDQVGIMESEKIVNRNSRISVDSK